MIKLIKTRVGQSQRQEIPGRNRRRGDELPAREHCHGANEKVLIALTYRLKSPQAGLKTNVEYVGYIVSGLRERSAPEDYIASFKAIASLNNPEIAASLDEM